MKGYKYVAWDMDETNSQIYLTKAANGDSVYSSELKIAQGYYDKETVNGIHFCRSQEDLIKWVQDCFEWEDPSCIEILEVIAEDSVNVRLYEDGRKAYISEKCKVRVLRDEEYNVELLRVITNHYG